MKLNDIIRVIPHSRDAKEFYKEFFGIVTEIQGNNATIVSIKDTDDGLIRKFGEHDRRTNLYNFSGIPQVLFVFEVISK